MDVATRGVSAVVEYDYTAKEPDELDLVKGAIISNIKQMPGGWWEGTLQSNGKKGMFPDNFVRIVEANSNEDISVTLREKSASSNRRCKVIYSYTQVNDDELSLTVGDVIEFLGEVEEGWWRGRLKSKVGVFPSNFVISIEPSPILASKRPPTSAAATALASTASANSSGSNVAATNKTAATNPLNNTSSAAAAALATKKTNRLSFHSSKEDLLGSSNSSSNAPTTITAAASLAAPAATTALVDDAAPILPPKPQREYCRVEFPYAPQNDDELELKVGDVITVISTELPDKGWWKGELRGKVGVFPDNFVKLLAITEVSPLNDSQQSQRTAKSANASHSVAATTATNNHSSSSTHVASSSTTITNSSSTSASATSKVFIKKSGSSSSTHSSNRRDSFGSRDSLNDILSETGLPSGNVAAQRKSLENKNLDLSNPPDASTRLGLKKVTSNSSSSSTSHSHSTSTTTVMSSGSSNTAELRKSLENIDEKLKTPPPVLTKKPTVPTKKSTTVTSVAGNIFSGLKQKVKNVENKLTTTTSQDSADGVGSSKMSPGGLPEAGAGGNVVMRRAATIAVEDSDFDRVERSSILPDVRAGRVKAPKRRPPSAAINVIGESNNNSVYLNGSGGSAELLHGEDGGSKPQSSDDNSTGEEQLAKPKPREWEKIKAPWMEELKASQVKKKTSPSVEPRTAVDTKQNNNTATSVISSSTSSTSASSSSTTTKVQSATISSSSMMQQSMTVESSQQHRSSNSGMAADLSMSKSVSGKLTSDVDDVRARPNSLSIRNRSISPSLNNNNASGAAAAGVNAGAGAPSSTARAGLRTSGSAAVVTTTEGSNSTAAKASSSILNNHHENNVPPTVGSKSSADSGGTRVNELEKRIEKLESVVHAQQRTIDELVRTLREETDRVKVLRGELDKYAQCVTQV